MCEGLRKPSQGEHLLGVTAMMGELPKSILRLFPKLCKILSSNVTLSYTADKYAEGPSQTN